MRWPRLNFFKMPLIVLVTVTVDVGGVAKMKLLLLVYQSYDGNDIIDQVATNWTKPTRIPGWWWILFSFVCVCIFFYAFFRHLTFVFALFTIVYFLLFINIGILFHSTMRSCIRRQLINRFIYFVAIVVLYNIIILCLILPFVLYICI